MLQQSTREFALRMAIQHIGYWRKCKADRLPKSAGFNRRNALLFIRAFKTGAV